MTKTMLASALLATFAAFLFLGAALTPAEAAGGLSMGEYACYGAGGDLLMGLGFQVLDGSNYDDLDRKSPGTYSIDGDTIAFHGGHLDDEVGAGLNGDGQFTIENGAIACEPFK